MHFILCARHFEIYLIEQKLLITKNAKMKYTATHYTSNFMPHSLMVPLIFWYTSYVLFSDLWQDLISGCLQHVEQDVQVILMI